MEEETIKLRVGMSVSYAANAAYEDVIDTGIARSDWEKLTPYQKLKEREMFARDLVNDHLESWAEEVED